MKTLISALILAAATAAHASITITFDKPTQTAVAGQTITFFGTITNTGSSAVFLNSDDFTVAGKSFTLTDQFFNTVPLSLAAAGTGGSSSGDIELFDITVSNPLVDPLATYISSYDLVGGIDGNAQDNLASANFSITPAVAPVPEPATIYLLFGGISSAILPIARKMKARAA
jgi:hypothetical protein